MSSINPYSNSEYFSLVSPSQKKARKREEEPISSSSRKRARIDRDANSSDRFIPDRNAMEQAQSSDTFSSKPPETRYQQAVMKACFPSHNPQRTLLFRQPVSLKPGFLVPAKPKSSDWTISDTPVRILAAPNTVDDFYMHTMDWGKGMILAEGKDVFFCTPFDPKKASSQKVSSIPNRILSVKSCFDDSLIAIGDRLTILSIVDIATQKIIRSSPFQDRGYSGVWCISSDPSSSDRSITLSLQGKIIHVDLRQARPAWTTEPSEADCKPCAIEWNASGQLLATGDNWNRVRVFDIRREPPAEQAIYEKTCRAAVKALRWNPRKENVLMAGAGTADQHLYALDVQKKKEVATQNLHAQICDLRWLDEESVVVGTGFSSSETVSVWRYVAYPFGAIERIKGLGQQRQRVLNVVKDPNSGHFATHSIDETVCIWNAKKENPDEEVLKKAKPPRIYDTIR
jgi:WD40 repeat protein